MTTATTTKVTLAMMAENLGVTIEEVAIRCAGSYSRHLAVKGTAFCGRINNDGYNITSQYESFDTNHICVTCLTRYNAKIAKIAESKVTTTYADLLKEVSVSITPNDAAFLAEVLTTMINLKEVTPTQHVIDLVAKLHGKVVC